MSKPFAGQLSILSNYHRSSCMNAGQVQDYIDLLVKPETVAKCGELYVARQLDWAVLELERLGGRV
jgi:hypothetical protein